MMGGRGRGRGRGRGVQMSFDYSQLGFSGGEALPAPVLQPPPTFPPLEYKPVPLKQGPETEYMVALKWDFVEFLHSIRQSNDSSSMIERFSDKYQMISSELKENWESQINWDYFPSELNPKVKKTSKRKLEKIVIGAETAKKPHVDVTAKLDELAKFEDKDEDEDEEAKETEEKEGEDENDKENPEEEEDEDEEMDDGTDYVNNYFDNGESYFDDEDDNLDDGPIY